MLDTKWNTPPELQGEGEDSEVGKSPKWDDPAHDAPWSTPKDFIMEESEEADTPGDNMPPDMITTYTPVEEALAAVFHGMNAESLTKEWNIPVDGEDNTATLEDQHPLEAEGTSDDDLVKKVLRNLRGDSDMEEIAVENYQMGDPVAEPAGTRRGGDIKAKQRQVLKVGQLHVRLPAPKSPTTAGEGAKLPRGSLAAKVMRLARQATVAQGGGDTAPARGSTRQFPAGAPPPKPPLKRRRRS